VAPLQGWGIIGGHQTQGFALGWYAAPLWGFWTGGWEGWEGWEEMDGREREGRVLWGLGVGGWEAWDWGWE